MLRALSKPLQVLLALMVCVCLAAICFQPTVDAFKLGEYAKTVKRPDLSQRLAKDFTAKKKLLKRELSEEDGEDEYEGEQMSAEADNSMEESQEDEDGFTFRKVSRSDHVIKKRERSDSNEESEEQDEVKPKSGSGFFDSLKFWKSEESVEEIEQAEEAEACTDKPAEQQGYPLFQWLKDYIKRKKSDSSDEDDTSAEQQESPATSSEDKTSFLSSVMDTVSVFKSTVSKAASAVSETASENLKFSLFDEDNDPPPSKPVISYEEFQKLLLQLPSFVPNYTSIYNIDCKRQGQIFERQLRAHKTWTLQLMDANAKLPSGILRGNINQLGDFDQCLAVATKIKVTEDQSIRFRGKYCLAHIELQPKDEDLRASVNALHGKGSLRSSFKDPNHFLPRFTTANWGLCVPSSCSTDDAELILQRFLKPYNTTLGIKLFVEVNEGNCVMKGSTKGWAHFFLKNWKTTASVCIFALLGSITFLATFDDFWALSNFNTIFQKEPITVTEVDDAAKPEAESDAEPAVKVAEPEEPAAPGVFKQIFHAFSMKRNVPALLEANINPDGTVPNFACIHGIRALATLALFMALKFIPLGKIPYSNRYALTELFNWPISVLLRAVFLYMETYLVVNGLLAGYGMSKEFRERGKINVARRIIGRILRLAPALGATLLFYSFIWEHLGDGPQWNDVVTTNANLCKRNWWQNMFFIQNWFPVERMCATHTFQLSIELQLYALLPLLIWLLYKHPDRGLGVLCAVIGLSTAARYSSIADNRLSLLVFHGMKLSQIYRTMNFSYASVLHRVTSYLVGAGVGILIQEEENRPKERIFTTLSKGFIQIGWISSFYCMFWLFWTQTGLAGKHYLYDPSAAAQYGALAPLLWSLSICWIVYACNNGCGDRLNRVLSSRPLVLVSRLSYAMCLIQFLVFFYTVGVTRDTEVFGFAALFNRNEVVCLVSGALLLTLLVDMPVQNLKRIFFAPREEESLATLDADKATMEKAVEEDFKSPFEDRDEDDFGARPVFRSRQASLEQIDPVLPSTVSEGKDDSETESADHFWDRRHQDRTTMVDSTKETLEDEEEEEEAEEEEPEEEEEEETPKPQNGGAQRIRWRWDVQEN